MHGVLNAMTRPNLQDMTVDQLMARYISIGVDQDGALLRNQYGKFNRLYDEKKAIENELKRRSGDQRRVLLRLYDHPNAQVRLNAAKATLAVAPEPARRKLQTMADSREFPQAGDAGMTLDFLDDGTFKPK
jgi:Domain of unknown function (DUF2019)